MSNGITGLQSQHWAFLASSCLYLCLSSGFHLPFLALFLLLKIAFCVSFMILSFSHLLSFLSHFCLLEIMQLVWVDREKMSFSVEHPSIQIHLKTKLYSIQYAPCQINTLSIEKQILNTFLRIYQIFIWIFLRIYCLFLWIYPKDSMTHSHDFCEYLNRIRIENSMPKPPHACLQRAGSGTWGFPPVIIIIILITIIFIIIIINLP